mmetsp:Transcript_21668/g.60232  ORF Transcript_21668/g.60232 Transcript_21668/m.60232 type:complete len:404 (+) Transcript_21668:166-1377(+)|eukprot:CAMPEP_0117674242 /NCGR_PEP_ID=MMETSP0804-20121206/14924_1 /TAXON_ID=1074897 /ORGANISM="Tetraselmis astigmatica, Strain CCMP880" /LENGTH=403 /DNA_ID=CAMNT_0005483079 /DNA_START=100 /DNA_END=1311 /DNA_ORIENTATION=-
MAEWSSPPPPVLVADLEVHDVLDVVPGTIDLVGNDAVDQGLDLPEGGALEELEVHLVVDAVLKGLRVSVRQAAGADRVHNDGLNVKDRLLQGVGARQHVGRQARHIDQVLNNASIADNIIQNNGRHVQGKVPGTALAAAAHSKGDVDDVLQVVLVRIFELVDEDDLNVGPDPVQLHVVEHCNVQNVLHDVVVSVGDLVHEDGVQDGGDVCLRLRGLSEVAAIAAPFGIGTELQVQIVLRFVTSALLDVGEREPGELQEDVVQEVGVVEDLQVEIVYELVLGAVDLVHSKRLDVRRDGRRDGLVQGQELDDVIDVVALAHHDIGDDSSDVRSQVFYLGNGVLLRQLYRQLVVNVLPVAFDVGEDNGLQFQVKVREHVTAIKLRRIKRFDVDVLEAPRGLCGEGR